MSILDTIKIDLKKIHREKINIIDEFDFSKTAKKVSLETNLNDPVFLNEGIENLKRYYIVALLDPLNKHAVSETIDPFWHAHILFTHDYHKFCHDVFNQYVHHEPLDNDQTIKVKEVEDLYAYTLEIYEKIFYTIDHRWWPKLGDTLNIGY